MNVGKWPAFSSRLLFGPKLADEPGMYISNGDMNHKNLWTNSLSSSSYDGYGSSSSDVTENYPGSFSGSEATSKKISEPSTWSLISAASTSTSSFYPAYASLPAPKPFKDITSRKNQAVQQQEISISLGREHEEDGSETEKAQTIDSMIQSKESIKSLPQSAPLPVEKMHSLSEEKLKRIYSSDDEKDEKVRKLMSRVAELEAQTEEQRRTISKLREESVGKRMNVVDSNKERENLLVRNASLVHQLEYEKREWSIEREQLAMQLDDVTRELELQKMLLNSESISEIVQRWESKVFDLQGMIYDRDRAIRAQQQRISELMQANSNSRPSINSAIPLSTFANIKRTVLHFLTGRHQRNAEQSLKAMSNALQLTKEEENAVRKSTSVY